VPTFFIQDVYVRLGDVNIKHTVAEWHDVLIAFSTFVDRETAGGAAAAAAKADEDAYWVALGLPIPDPTEATAKTHAVLPEAKLPKKASKKDVRKESRRSVFSKGSGDRDPAGAGAIAPVAPVVVTRMQLVAFYDLYDERLKVANVDKVSGLLIVSCIDSSGTVS
jgi:hypothetical protein